MYKKNAAKKVFCRPVAIDWGRTTSALPNLSNRESEGQDIRLSLGFQGSPQRCLPFWFVSFRSVFTYVHFTHVVVCFPARPLTVYKHLVYFWSSKKKKISETKELYHGNVGKKKKKKRTNASIFKKCNATLHRMKIYCATFRTLGLNSVVLFCLTFFVLC